MARPKQVLTATMAKAIKQVLSATMARTKTKVLSATMVWAIKQVLTATMARAINQVLTAATAREMKAISLIRKITPNARQAIMSNVTSWPASWYGTLAASACHKHIRQMMTTCMNTYSSCVRTHKRLQKCWRDYVVRVCVCVCGCECACVRCIKTVGILTAAHARMRTYALGSLTVSFTD